VPGIEVDDAPLLNAMAANDAALFVVLRSDNLSGERTLALKRAFNGAKKPEQHLLALRLEPTRAATAVRTIARRLQQLLSPKRPAPRPKPDAPKAKPQVDEWAGTLIHEKSTAPPPSASPRRAAAAKSPPATPADHTWSGTLIADESEPKPISATTSKPSPPPPTPARNERKSDAQWGGTMIADEQQQAQLTDAEATPLPTPERMPPSPSASQSGPTPAAQWGGTLIADPDGDFDFTLPQDLAPQDTVSSDDSASWDRPERVAGRSSIGWVIGILAVVVVGGVATAFALQESDGPPPNEVTAPSTVAESKDHPSDSATKPEAEPPRKKAPKPLAAEASETQRRTKRETVERSERSESGPSRDSDAEAVEEPDTPAEATAPGRGANLPSLEDDLDDRPKDAPAEPPRDAAAAPPAPEPTDTP
jgi:hypothetical protein